MPEDADSEDEQAWPAADFASSQSGAISGDLDAAAARDSCCGVGPGHFAQGEREPPQKGMGSRRWRDRTGGEGAGHGEGRNRFRPARFGFERGLQAAIHAPGRRNPAGAYTHSYTHTDGDARTAAHRMDEISLFSEAATRSEQRRTGCDYLLIGGLGTAPDSPYSAAFAIRLVARW